MTTTEKVFRRVAETTGKEPGPDWKPIEEDWRNARHRLGVRQAEKELERCKSRLQTMIQRGDIEKDWDAFFRNWIERAVKLSTPIIISRAPPSLLEPSCNDAPGRSPQFEEIALKLRLLADHYDATVGGTINFMTLALNMALDLISGFQVLNDHVGARQLGLPDAYYGSTRPRSKGNTVPEWVSGEMLSVLIPGIQKQLPNLSEAQISVMLAGALMDSDLKAGRQKGKLPLSELKSRGKTMTARLALYRKSARAKSSD